MPLFNIFCHRRMSSSTTSFSSSSSSSSMSSSSSTHFSASYASAMLKKREAEFCDLVDCTIFLGTWNVNGKLPGEPLNAWLLPTAETCDIYAVG